jgi:hypothetical protein
MSTQYRLVQSAKVRQSCSATDYYSYYSSSYYYMGAVSCPLGHFVWLRQAVALVMCVKSCRNLLSQKSELSVSNVVVEWLTLLLRIRKVPGSNLVPDTSPD